MDRKWWTLIAVCTGTFMLLLDVTIVNVALPSIQRSLNASFSDLQWVVDAYALTLAALLLTTGSLADLFGRRRMFVIGLVIFSVSSLLSGIAADPLLLNLARGAQGVGGAAMFSTSLALLGSAFQGRERGTAFGVWGAITGLAVAIGPVVGGALTSGLSWRWIFLVNVPIGAAAVAMTVSQVEESRQPGRPASGLHRRGHVQRRARRAGLRADQGQQQGLGLDRDRRLPHRRPPSCSSPSWWPRWSSATAPCST